MARDDTSPTPRSSEMIDRRKVLIGIGFAGAAGLAALRQPRQRIDFLGKRKLEDLVPRTIGDWQFLTASGLIVPPADQLSDSLYSQLLTRVYTDGKNTPMMLLIAQSAGQTGVLQVHRPEYCYPAGGYTLSPIERRHISAPGKALTANSLTATIPGVQEQILYWTRVGTSMPLSWAEQRAVVFEANLAGEIPDAVLMRVSTINPDPAAAFSLMSRFVSQLLGSLKPSDRTVLVA